MIDSWNNCKMEWIYCIEFFVKVRAPFEILFDVEREISWEYNEIAIMDIWKVLFLIIEFCYVTKRISFMQLR